MQQRLEIKNKVLNFHLNSAGEQVRDVTYIAESVNKNGINLHLQIQINESDKTSHLHTHFMQSYLKSGDEELDIGSIIQIDIQHRYQRVQKTSKS